MGIITYWLLGLFLTVILVAGGYDLLAATASRSITPTGADPSRATAHPTCGPRRKGAPARHHDPATPTVRLLRLLIPPLPDLRLTRPGAHTQIPHPWTPFRWPSPFITAFLRTNRLRGICPANEDHLRSRPHQQHPSTEPGGQECLEQVRDGSPRSAQPCC